MNLRKETKEYIKRVEDTAAILEIEMIKRLPDIIITTSQDSAHQLPYINLTTAETHILVKCIVPIRFYSLHNFLIENEAPIPCEAKAFCTIIARLIARKHLTLQYADEIKPTAVSYTGTLTVNADGLITFMPDDPYYTKLVGIPLLTVITQYKNSPKFKPLIIRAEASKQAKPDGRS